jgi:hypothetical protein
VTVYFWMILAHDYDAIESPMTMITTLLLSFLIVLSAIGVMAIGVLVGRKRLRGSCGGISNGACELCGNDSRTTETAES